MAIRTTEVIACSVVAAIAIGGVCIYLAQPPAPMDVELPQVEESRFAKTAPPARPKAQAPRPAVERKQTERKAKAAEPTAPQEPTMLPPPPPGPPGGPEVDKEYTLAEAEEALEAARAKSVEAPEFREIVNSWHNFLADPIFTRSANYKEHLEKLAAMAEAQSPRTATPLIAMAHATLHEAWQERGEGSDEGVTEEVQQRFRSKAAEARQLLEQAVDIGVRDGHAHTLMLEVARIEGRPLNETRALLEAGRKIDPTYHWLYEAMAEYLLPRWHGQPGDVEKFAAEVAQSLPGDEGLDAYMHIAYAVQQFDSNILYWGDFDRELLAKGAEVVVKRYPSAPNVVPFGALCTVVAQDRAAARRIRPGIHSRDSFRVWLWGVVANDFFRWCDAEEVASGQADWLWGTPLNYPTLSFGRDSKSLWCASGVGSSVVTLWNLDAKKVDAVLPARGSRIQRLAVDPAKNWAAATLTCQRALKTSQCGRNEMQPFCRERNSTLAFSNTSRVAGDGQWRMSSRWRRFSLYNNSTRQVGHSGGSPAS